MGVPVPEDDGLRVRDANTWAHDKLDIVECYLAGFARACTKAGDGVVVDEFAGPGVNRFPRTRPSNEARSPRSGLAGES